MFLELQKLHKSNSSKLIVVCNYGYFLKGGKWEAIAINLKLIGKTLWIWRKKKYKNEWPVACG